MKLDWNDARILAALPGPFREANELLARACQEEITANQWGWPAPPSPRDIVDTGRLRDSYTPIPGDFEFDHLWNVEYAMAVHEGAMLRDNRTLTARPWTRTALRRFDFEAAFNRLARRALERI